MSAAIAALVIGTVLAVGALAFVLYPIFFVGQSASHAAHPSRSALEGPVPDNLAVAALREIEFDRATGKLSDGDYAQLKERYTREALAAMRQSESAATTSTGPALSTTATGDDVEAAITAWRARHPVCASCGPRPESDARFCSSCGRFLPGACAHCGARIDEIGARFCRACGHRLAA